MLADQHIHSKCSEDASDTMLDMAAASKAYGVDALCFTDHCDLDVDETGKSDPDYFRVWPRTLAMYRESEGKFPIDVRLGLELGGANHNPEAAARMSALPELDLVMGSIHNLRDTIDFYYIKYDSEEQCRALLDRYADELVELSEMDCFDVMSHIGYTRRYMLRAGYDIYFDMASYGDRLETVLRNLAESGRGIEINCSCPRTDPVLRPTPGLDVLRRFRELGGEIVTVGSDAHRVASAGVRIAWGHEQLRLAGFKYAALFKDRTPEFYEL